MSSGHRRENVELARQCIKERTSVKFEVCPNGRKTNCHVSSMDDDMCHEDLKFLNDEVALLRWPCVWCRKCHVLVKVMLAMEVASSHVEILEASDPL